MTDEQIERLGRLGEALEKIAPFTTKGNRYGVEQWFSREYVLKNILGLTDEEYNTNEKMIEDLAAQRLAKQKRIEALSKIKEAESDFVEEDITCSCDYDSCSELAIRSVAKPKFLKAR
jgi:hypothetical protein